MWFGNLTFFCFNFIFILLCGIEDQQAKVYNMLSLWASGGMVYAVVSKTTSRKAVWVRLPPCPQIIMDNLLKFIKSQSLMAIASSENNDAWIANVYVGVDDKGTIYFISPKDNRHSKMILKNPKVSFSIAWFDPKNHKNRKSVQGLGMCRPAENEEEIINGVKLHNKNFPEFKERITVDWIHNNEWGSKVWVLKPNYMKYWDDEIYKDQENEEFNL